MPKKTKKRKATKKKKTVKRKATKRKATKKRKPARKKKTTKRKATKKKATKKKKPAKKKKASKKKRKPNAAFMRKFKASAKLQAVVGSSSISRPEATKKIWEFIRKHKLQDNKNRRQINVGGTKLGEIFPGKRSITMFEVAKGLSKHLS